MNYKVNLVFPCDFENENKKKSKVYTKCFLKTKDDFRYSSPIFSINKNMNSISVKTNKKKCVLKNKISSKKDEKDVVNEIFDSCKMQNGIGKIALKFKVKHLFFPYGIGLGAELKDSEINTILEVIHRHFKPFSKDSVKDKRENLEWIIYDKPLIIIEPCQEINISKIKINICLDVHELSCNQMKISASNDIIVLQNSWKIDRHELDSVLAVFIALKNLSSNVRLKSKQLAPAFNLSSTQKNDTVKEIHNACAVFDEIDNKNIFYTEKEQELFEVLRTLLCVDEQKRQIRSARDNGDYLLNEFIDKKTDRINDTLFITGYIGLILSFFAFTPIELHNILWIAKPLEPREKIFFCVTLMLMLILSIMILRNLYLGAGSLIERYAEPKMIWLKKLCVVLFASAIIYLLFILFVNGYLCWV